MKVSESSWHYKLVDYFNWEHSESLCFYFWQVVAGCLCTIGIFVVFLMLMFILISFPGVIVASKLFNSTEVLYYITWVGLSVLFWTSFVLIGVGFGKFIEYKRNKKPSTNILFQYIKAKKSKICPVIEFEK